MAQKQLKELTVDELKQRAKSIKIVTWFLVVMLLVLFCVTLYQSIRDGKIQTLLFVPIALFPIVLFNFVSIKKINSEVKSRSKL
jgi:hypothetical protein